MCKFLRQISCKISIGFMNIGPKLGRYYTAAMVVYLMAAVCTVPAYAATDIFAAARSVIIDVYNGIAGISTVLAGLMSAVAVIGAKMSSNQHKVDQSWTG